MTDLTSNKSRVAPRDAEPKPLHFVMLRQATADAYSVFRCKGSAGCGERVSADAVAEHAAKQHSTYDYDRDLEVKTVNG